MTANRRRLAGAMAGGLVAGLALSALLIAGEQRSGKPSELTDLKRAGLRALGLETPSADVLPSLSEQAAVQGGHLALSALAGATYAVATRERAPVLASGVGFGIAFYTAAHWIAGPLLGLKEPEWQAGPGTIGMHAANHIVFGLVTAIAANAAARV